MKSVIHVLRNTITDSSRKHSGHVFGCLASPAMLPLRAKIEIVEFANRLDTDVLSHLDIHGLSSKIL